MYCKPFIPHNPLLPLPVRPAAGLFEGRGTNHHSPLSATQGPQHCAGGGQGAGRHVPRRVSGCCWGVCGVTVVVLLGCLWCFLWLCRWCFVGVVGGVNGMLLWVVVLSLNDLLLGSLLGLLLLWLYCCYFDFANLSTMWFSLYQLYHHITPHHITPLHHISSHYITLHHTTTPHYTTPTTPLHHHTAPHRTTPHHTNHITPHHTTPHQPHHSHSKVLTGLSVNADMKQVPRFHPIVAALTLNDAPLKVDPLLLLPPPFFPPLLSFFLLFFKHSIFFFFFFIFLFFLLLLFLLFLFFLSSLTQPSLH